MTQSLCRHRDQQRFRDVQQVTCCGKAGVREDRTGCRLQNPHQLPGAAGGVVVVAGRVSRGHRDLGLRDWLGSRPSAVSPYPSGVCRCVTNCHEHPILHDADERVCSPWRRAFGITPGKVASRARSAQFSFGRRGCRRCSTASWWRRIKISAVFHISSCRDCRNPAATRVIRRNTNRRHMIGDHQGWTAGRTTLLVRAVDEILGTHRPRYRTEHVAMAASASRGLACAGAALACGAAVRVAWLASLPARR
jgi:hypothetical protein